MSINHRLGGPPRQDPVSVPCTAIRTIAIYCPPPVEGAGGGAERAGRRGLVYVNRSTGDTPRQGRGMFHPPPRQPLPHGGDIPVDTAPRERSPSAGFRRELPEESCLRPPCTAIEPIAIHCPPPVEGAGGGRASGREAGVVNEYRSR